MSKIFSLKNFRRGESGVSLIETLIAIALLGIIGSVLMSGMGGIYKTTPIASEQDISKSLAQSQIEYVLQAPYAYSYTAAPIPSIYTGYTATISASTFRDGNIEKITVTIYHNGNYVFKLEAYKTNR